MEQVRSTRGLIFCQDGICIFGINDFHDMLKYLTWEGMRTKINRAKDILREHGAESFHISS